jgi:hypothetical protein
MLKPSPEGEGSPDPDGDYKFVGRHQQICFVKHLLGEDVPSLSWQMAKNKDFSDRSEILENIESLQKYIKSETYTTAYDVGTIFDSIKKIIDEGFRSHVLQNDQEIEERCFEIYKDVIDYSNNKGKNDGTLTTEQISKMEALPELLRGKGILYEMDGGDFDTPFESHVWLVYFSLQPNYYTNALITTILASVSGKDVNVLVPEFKLAIKKLVENKKIGKDEVKKLVTMIENGLQKNQNSKL